MKKSLAITLATLFTVAPLAALANNCEEIKADIAQKIVSNGVPEDGFTLSTLPVGQNVPEGAKSVGGCDKGQQQIIYSRTARLTDAQPDQTPKVEDTEHPELQPQTEPQTEPQTQP
ncbi:Protein of uncharacterised function (DUF1161) [Leminorella richardii]|uniref:Protein of uncharacterized function (DUF1161) n=1 Tax=Leminorella richardii TaxID=158841 RepID=A0A2X4V6R5_9GAMM|nr:DUF1161 domain-containing protein [Leminorella richardii]SQI40970.1 Protein of uncharacterised function (DUF1161) [Leminorella richardii]